VASEVNWSFGFTLANSAILASFVSIPFLPPSVVYVSLLRFLLSNMKVFCNLGENYITMIY